MKSSNVILNRSISQVVTRLQENKRVRRNLPLWGRIHIDRQLPFLCVYRQPTKQQDNGTERLIMGQPAYLAASAQKTLAPSLAQLVLGTVKTMSAAFGSVLIVEIWSGLEAEEPGQPDEIIPKPAFKIVASNQNGITNTLETLESELFKIKVHQMQAEVSLANRAKPGPPRLSSLLTESAVDQLNCSIVGIVIRPIYRHPDTGDILPLIHQTMMRDFNQALQRTFFTFTRTKTQYQPPHYQMLGRHATVRAVWHIDKQLADISSSFDYLLQVTPINANEAWTKFKRYRFERQPTFRYRPHAVDPALLKRQLWNIRVERVEDPTLQHLFREKRKELDIQISMLGNMNKPSFLLGSLQLYGHLDAQLVATAKKYWKKSLTKVEKKMNIKNWMLKLLHHMHVLKSNVISKSSLDSMRKSGFNPTLLV